MTRDATRAESGLRNLAATEREGSLSCSLVKAALMVLTAFYHADGPLSLSDAKDGAYAAPWDMSDVMPRVWVYS